MCGPLLFELKERVRGYPGQTSTLGTGRRQGYQVAKGLAHLALPRWSHGVLSCGQVGGKAWPAPLGQSTPETPRQGELGDSGWLSRWSAPKRG
jgi:hypothetical protein